MRFLSRTVEEEVCEDIPDKECETVVENKCVNVSDIETGTNCIKIDLPGKLILSKRKDLHEVIFY